MPIFDPNIFDRNIFDTPPVTVPQVGVYKPRRRRKIRVPLTTEVVAVSPLSLPHLVNCQLLSELARHLTINAYLTSELNFPIEKQLLLTSNLGFPKTVEFYLTCKLIEAVYTLNLKATGTLTTPVTLEGFVTSPLNLLIEKHVQLHGKVDLKAILKLLEAVENDDTNYLIAVASGNKTLRKIAELESA